MAKQSKQPSDNRAIALPMLMKAAAIDRFGPPSAITLHTLPVAKLGAREILIAIHVAGVGEWDESIRDGSWRPAGRTKFPLVLGVDGAGVVVMKGSRVRRFRVGDWAYSYASGNAKGGFYAEYVAVDERKAGRVPPRLDRLQAGAATVTALTALQGIDDTLHLRRRETILIFGASGAVGTLAVQFAKRHGARVLATASGQSARRVVRKLGADVVVDARSPDVDERLREAAPDGIDAVLALAGGRGLERCLDFVRDGGRVAHPNGIEPEPNPRRAFRVRGYDAASGPREFTRLARAIADAKLQVPIAAQYPLSKAALAHRRLHSRVVGRIVLRVRRTTTPLHRTG